MVSFMPSENVGRKRIPLSRSLGALNKVRRDAVDQNKKFLDEMYSLIQPFLFSPKFVFSRTDSKKFPLRWSCSS